MTTKEKIIACVFMAFLGAIVWGGAISSCVFLATIVIQGNIKSPLTVLSASAFIGSFIGLGKALALMDDD